MSQRLIYRTLDQFDQLTEQRITVQDYVTGATIVPVLVALFSYGKLAASHETMLLTNWSDHVGHDPGTFLTHIRFGPSARGTMTAVNHQQGVRDRKTVLA